MSSGSVLVVAATARELAPAAGWRTLRCGVGPVDAGVHTAACLASDPPRALLHVGIAGARRASGLVEGTMVIGSAARYADLEVPARFAPSELWPSDALLAALQQAFPSAPLLPIATTARVGGSRDEPVEAMEGFAVLRAAALAGVPAIEVRVIANAIEETDRTRWAFDLAFDALVACTPRLVEALQRV